LTVGTVDEKTIREYIENQRWDDHEEKFKITAPTKLSRLCAGDSSRGFSRSPTFSRKGIYRLQPVLV
jgi:hypothetical protein